jgi:hypothetical protein
MLQLRVSTTTSGNLRASSGDESTVAGCKKQWSDPEPSLLAVDGGMHPLDDSVDSGPSHYKGVMLEDTVNIEALRFMKAE